MSRDEEIPDADRAGNAPLPRQTSALFGHGAAELALLDGYRAGRLAHAWILGGPEGIGKATLAWRFARFLLAHPDPNSAQVRAATSLATDPEHKVARRMAAGGHGNVFRLRREWDRERKKLRTEISIDSVRECISMFHQSAAVDGWRVCIVDSAEELNKNSANALLKLIEEPPARSLFLIISQKPGQLLPTIRSRCRKLMMPGLAEVDIIRAIESLPASMGRKSQADLTVAAARAEGSVREALRLLDQETLVFDRRLGAALARLPGVEWRDIHSLADNVTGKDGERAYDTLMRGVFGYLAQAVRAGAQAGQSVPRLARLAEGWEKLRDLVREAEALNLDKRALVLTLFMELAEATGAAAP